MEIIYLNKLKKKVILSPHIYTIGNFDGVHIGHRILLNNTASIAKKLSSNFGIITFNPNTKSFFNSTHKFLGTLEQKLKHFRNLKIPRVIIIDFNEVYNLSSYDFIKSCLINVLNSKALVVGSNFKLGMDLLKLNPKNYLTSSDLIKNNVNCKDYKIKYYGSELLNNTLINKATYYGKKQKFKLVFYSMNIEKIDNIKISSSVIKDLLNQGKIKESNKLLGYNFVINSIVIHGNKLGRTLGTPTINMLIPKYVKLKYGIYATRAHLPNGEVKDSVSSFGVRPTIANSNKEEILETFIFDYSDDLYDQNVGIEFFDYIREEKKFSSLEELKESIKQDIEKSKSILKTN